MWRRVALLLAISALAPDAQAQSISLQGQWQVRSTRYAAYEAVVLIDRAGRVTFDSPMEDDGPPAKFRGCGAKSDDDGAEIVLTDKSAATRVRCNTQSADLLHSVTLGDGGKSAPYSLVRIGLAPATLLR